MIRKGSFWSNTARAIPSLRLHTSHRSLRLHWLHHPPLANEVRAGARKALDLPKSYYSWLVAACSRRWSGAGKRRRGWWISPGCRRLLIGERLRLRWVERRLSAWSATRSCSTLHAREMGATIPETTCEGFVQERCDLTPRTAGHRRHESQWIMPDTACSRTQLAFKFCLFGIRLFGLLNRILVLEFLSINRGVLRNLS